MPPVDIPVEWQKKKQRNLGFCQSSGILEEKNKPIKYTN